MGDSLDFFGNRLVYGSCLLYHKLHFRLRIPRFPVSPIPQFPDSLIPRFADSPIPCFSKSRLSSAVEGTFAWLMASRMIFKYKLYCTRQEIQRPPKKFANRVIEEKENYICRKNALLPFMSVITWPSHDMAISPLSSSSILW